MVAFTAAIPHFLLHVFVIPMVDMIYLLCDFSFGLLDTHIHTNIHMCMNICLYIYMLFLINTSEFIIVFLCFVLF